MKKVLSFVLVLAMILGSVATVFAAPVKAGDAVSEKNTVVPFADAVDNYMATILRDLGAVDGDGTGNVNPDGELTRAEAYTFIVKAMGLKAEGEVKQATKFKDVAKDDWYSGYVAVAAAQKYTDGTGNGTFSPEAKMTKDEAVAAILKVLGYQAEHLEGVWPVNYRDLALNMGILGSVEVGSEVATRADMIELIYNCLDEQLVVWKENTFMGGQYAPSTNGLLLYQKVSSKLKDSPKVGGELYKKGNAEVLTDVAFANKFDAKDLRGNLVTILYKNTKAVGIYKVDTKTLTGKFSDGTLTTFTAIDGTVYTGLGKHADVAVFENGGLTDAAFTPDKAVTYTLNVKLDKTTPTKGATVCGIHYDKVNAVVKVNATEAALFAEENLYKVAANSDVSAPFKKIATSEAGTKVKVLDPKNPVEVVGDVDALDELAKGDIVEFYYDGKTEKVAKVAVTRNVVTGAITKYDAKNSAYTVNGKAYKMGTAVAEITDLTSENRNAAIKGATEYAFYLNSTGKIAWVEFVKEPKATVTYAYAFVLEATSKDESTLVDKTIKTVSNNAIKLLPLDTMVAETFEMVSAGALKGNLLATTGWNSKVTPSALVYYGTNEAGELVYLKLATDETADTKKFTSVVTETKFSTVGLTGAVTKQFADAKIYVAGVKGKVATDPAFYTTKTVADMNKATSASLSYKLNKNGRIDTVVVCDYNVAATKDVITVAAILGQDVDADGTYVTFVQPGKDEEALYVSAGATVVGVSNATLVAMELKNGKIAEMEELDVKATETDVVVFEDGVLKDDEKTTVKYDLKNDTVFFVWNATDKVLEEVTDADEINEALAKKGCVVDLYKVYQPDFYDAVVIR